MEELSGVVCSFESSFGCYDLGFVCCEFWIWSPHM